MLLFTLAYLQFGLRPVVERIADSHFKAAAEKMNASLDALFDPVDTWVRVAGQWAQFQGFDENRPEDFNRMFMPILKQLPQFTSVVAGTADGRGWMLLEKPDGAWMNRFTDIPRRGNVQLFVDWAADGSKQLRLEPKDYDPRTRPWFTGAVAAAQGTTFWTDPYLFFTTGDPGMTASTALVLPDGDTLALGIDIKLEDISRVTARTTVGMHGFASVLTGDGRLLGLPRTAEPLDAAQVRALALQPVAALGNRVMDAGIAEWKHEGRPNGQVLRFTAGKAAWLASFKAVRYGNQVLWVAVFAPEADFIPPWQPMARVLLVILSGVLVVSFLLALRYTRRFSEPLERLAESSARIAQLDFADGVAVHSDIAEIRQVAHAQDTMRSMLREYQRTVDSQSESLQRQVTELQLVESRLEHLSQHDPLTGLPNRLLFNDRLSAAITRAERYGARFAVLFLDLDRFKAVNDSQGHPVGDLLLRAVAERLGRILRKSDTLARLGGDEFVLLAEEIAEEKDAERLARKLLAELLDPLEVGERSFHLTGSLGISLYPDDGAEAVALIRNADSAMYQAKAEGRNTFRFYSADMTLRAVTRQHMEESLHGAIKRGEFELHYQPQLDLRDNRLIGAEALIRWRLPDQGLVMPNDFITLAEESGLIGPIGEWVLEESCRQWAEWSRQGLVLPRIAVNLSVKQFLGKELKEWVASTLEKFDMPPSVLELEMTESVLLESPEALGMLLEIGRTGVSFALDDFGTGYSSLAYLKKLPLARLKIDRGFTADIGIDADGETVVRAIIGLADSLGRDVIAEGVESREQIEFLVAHGCHQAQGYYFSRPVPGAQFAEWWVGQRNG
ncbi:MAG: EAL domain-containing protein [Thiobacillus sp.]|nr:EAL domain-containing protein [Thiobacillus sp.]